MYYIKIKFVYRDENKKIGFFRDYLSFIYFYINSNAGKCYVSFLSFRGMGEVGKGSLIGAVEKSFDKSKETVEESAESAAKVVEGAFQKKTEEEKERTDSKQEDKAEL